jgi:hypothetical protein
MEIPLVFDWWVDRRALGALGGTPMSIGAVLEAIQPQKCTRFWAK